MDEPTEGEMSVAQQAYEWFEALRLGGAKERAEFAQWLKTSPRHVGEFLAVTAMYREYADIDPQRRIDVDALLAEASSNVVSLDEGRGAQLAAAEPCRRPRRRTWVAGAMAAGIAALLALGGWIAMSLSGGTRYESAVGEIRSFELADGSVIYLNTASNVQVKLSKEARDVRLVTGEALFKVAHDPDRPFRVHSGSALIQALGTQFNVYRRVEGTTVAVLEGTVQINGGPMIDAHQRLDAGQGARIGTDGTISEIAKVDSVKVTAWQQRRLIFRNDTLADIAAEFNRYNKKPQFRVESEDIAARRFTGVFDAEAPESFMRVLHGVGNLEAERRGDEVVIRGR